MPPISPLCPNIKNHVISVREISGGWCLNVLCSASADRCLQVRENQVAQDSRLVTCDGEGLAQGSLPFNKLRDYVQFFLIL